MLLIFPVNPPKIVVNSIALNPHPRQLRDCCSDIPAQPGAAGWEQRVVLSAGGEAGLGAGMAEGHLWGRNAISWP